MDSQNIPMNKILLSRNGNTVALAFGSQEFFRGYVIKRKGITI